MFSALKTVSGNARLQEVWHFRHEQKIFGHPKFLWQLKKLIKILGYSPPWIYNFSGGAPPDSPQNVTPFLIHWLRAWKTNLILNQPIPAFFLATYCGMSFLAISALFLLYIHFGKSLWFTWIPCNEASACRVSIIKQQQSNSLLFQLQQR